MSESLLALVAEYGAVALFVTTFLSCLALPVPASALMLAGGAFIASGDLDPVQALPACLAGAVAGDMTGFLAARFLSERLQARIARRPSHAALLARASALADRWGGPGIYLSRWLVSPLGPYVNLALGAATYGWRRFLVWDILGEATWVGLYLGLGYAFARQLAMISEILANLSGLIAALAVTLAIGYLLVRTARQQGTGK